MHFLFTNYSQSFPFCNFLILRLNSCFKLKAFQWPKGHNQSFIIIYLFIYTLAGSVLHSTDRIRALEMYYAEYLPLNTDFDLRIYGILYYSFLSWIFFHLFSIFSLMLWSVMVTLLQLQAWLHSPQTTPTAVTQPDMKLHLNQVSCYGFTRISLTLFGDVFLT